MILLYEQIIVKLDNNLKHLRRSDNKIQRKKTTLHVISQNHVSGCLVKEKVNKLINFNSVVRKTRGKG